MLKLIDQIVAAGLLIVGVAHVVAASKAFTDPTQARVWFLSAGLLGLVALAAAFSLRGLLLR